jgi:hypothetical protein
MGGIEQLLRGAVDRLGDRLHLPVERGRKLGEQGPALGLGLARAFLLALHLVARARACRFAHADRRACDGAELVAALRAGDIRLDIAAGEALERAGQAAERSDDRTREQEHAEQQNRRGHADADEDFLQRRLIHRLDVVDDEAAGDHPSPGDVARGVGELRLVGRRLRQLVDVEHVPAAGLALLDEFTNEVLAVRVALIEAIGTDQLRLHGIDQHGAVEIIGEHVVVVAEAHPADGAPGKGLRLFLRDLALLRALVRIDDDTDRGLDQVLDLVFLLLEQIVAALLDYNVSDDRK